MNKCNFIAGTVLSGILSACPAMARAAERHAGAAGAAVEECDIVVYGLTPAAISAAVQAKRMGKTCVVVSPETRIGGLTTGGLGQTDTGNKAAFGGIAQALSYGPLAARLILDGQVLWTAEPPTELVVAASNSRAFAREPHDK